VWRSWDRGHKGHRILRRVLVGGRHLGTSRALGFHESVVTAALAASSRGKSGAKSSQELGATAGRQGEGTAGFRGRGRGDRGVRGKVGSRRRGKKTPTLLLSPTGHGERELEAKQAARVWLRSAEAFTSVVKTLGPPVRRTEPKTPRIAQAIHFARRRHPCGESRIASRERTKYGCT
jgi:hypothetical protein